MFLVVCSLVHWMCKQVSLITHVLKRFSIVAVCHTYDKVDLFNPAYRMWCNIRHCEVCKVDLFNTEHKMWCNIWDFEVFIRCDCYFHVHSVIWILHQQCGMHTSFLQWSKTIKALDIGDCYTKVKGNVQDVISDPESESTANQSQIWYTHI